MFNMYQITKILQHGHHQITQNNLVHKNGMLNNKNL